MSSEKKRYYIVVCLVNGQRYCLKTLYDTLQAAYAQMYYLLSYAKRQGYVEVEVAGSPQKVAIIRMEAIVSLEACEQLTWEALQWKYSSKKT